MGRKQLQCISESIFLPNANRCAALFVVRCHYVQLQRRHEQMKKNLEALHKELEEKRRQQEEEKASWEAQQRILEQQKLEASR